MGKKVLKQFKNSLLSEQQVFMNWLMERLPEQTRVHIRQVYERKYKSNPNEVYRDSSKKTIKAEPEAERFYRKIQYPSDTISTVGNVRPQNTVYATLDDEELGSTL